MQVVFLGRGPAFEGGLVAADGGEVAVVQPVDDLGGLLDADPLLGAVVGVGAAQGEAGAFLGCAGIVVFGPVEGE